MTVSETNSENSEELIDEIIEDEDDGIDPAELEMMLNMFD